MDRDIPEPDLSAIIESGHESWVPKTLKAWEQGDIIEILACHMPNTAELAFVADNCIALLKMGKYEEALLSAWVDTKTNFASWSTKSIRFMFDLANPEKLRAAGDPIPDKKEFTLYRGVAGKGKARRVNGISWTISPNVAAWFAKRFESLGLGDPAVFKITVPKDLVLAYTEERKESEFLLKLPLPSRPKRLKVMPEPISGAKLPYKVADLLQS